MKLLKHIAFVLLGLTTLSSCWMDTGDIPEKTSNGNNGASFRVRVAFKNTNAWPTNNQIAICAFAEDSENPFTWKVIQKNKMADTLDLALTGITQEPEYVSLSLINKARRRIYNFYTAKLAESDSTMLWTVDLLEMGRVQAQFFSNCQNCHGASSHAAANLYLTEGKTYNSLVNQYSTKETSRILVVPGVPSSSFIVDVVDGKTDKVHYDHTQVGYNNETEDIQLLKNWISSLDNAE